MPITVHFANHDRTYMLTPDRGNVVSYFKDCPSFEKHLSAEQYKIVHDVLTTGNRVPLLNPLVLGHRCGNQGTGNTCPLQAPADPLKQLLTGARQIADCYRAWRKPLPGEINEWLRVVNPGKGARIKLPVPVMHE